MSVGDLEPTAIEWTHLVSPRPTNTQDMGVRSPFEILAEQLMRSKIATERIWECICWLRCDALNNGIIFNKWINQSINHDPWRLGVVWVPPTDPSAAMVAYQLTVAKRSRWWYALCMICQAFICSICFQRPEFASPDQSLTPRFRIHKATPTTRRDLYRLIFFSKNSCFVSAQQRQPCHGCVCLRQCDLHFCHWCSMCGWCGS